MKELKTLSRHDITKKMQACTPSSIEIQPMSSRIYQPQTSQRKYSPRELAALSMVDAPEVTLTSNAPDANFYVQIPCHVQSPADPPNFTISSAHPTLASALDNIPSSWHLISSWVEKTVDTTPSRLYLEFMPINASDLYKDAQIAMNGISDSFRKHRNLKDAFRDIDQLAARTHRAPFEHEVSANPLWVDLEEQIAQAATMLRLKYGRRVIVEGNFSLWIRWRNVADCVTIQDNDIDYVTLGTGIQTQAYSSKLGELRIY